MAGRKEVQTYVQSLKSSATNKNLDPFFLNKRFWLIFKNKIEPLHTLYIVKNVCSEKLTTLYNMRNMVPK